MKMKKITMVLAAGIMALSFSACKKDDKNNGGNPNPATSCKLKSLKEITTESGQPNVYGGFAMYYDGDKVTRVNLLDSATGNEDSVNYVLLSYNSGNLTDIKVYQDAQLSVNMSLTYNSQNRVIARNFSLGGVGTVEQTYFYNNDGKLVASVQKIDITVPPFGKIESKDSALYNNYNSKGRPASITVYNSVKTQQGQQPYEFKEEFAYEYDANGNRTKESSKQDVADPLDVTRTATFDLTKTPGDAEKAYRLFTRITGDTWADPNLDTKDIDVNLITKEVTFDGNGNSETTNTSYTFNDRNNPATSKAEGPTQTKNSTYTYECK